MDEKKEKEFSDFFKNHYSRLYTLAFRITGDKEDAEDIIQTSFMNAYEAFSKFRGDASLYTWLYRIIINGSKKHLKQTRKLPIEKYSEESGLSEKEIYNHINSVGQVEDEVLVKTTRETCLQMFMNCLPGGSRVVYTLRVILDFNVKVTAEIMEISEASVKTKLHRARKQIKNHMAGRCSLVNPQSPCHCGKFAAYIKKNELTGHFQNMEFRRKKEKEAYRKFHREMSEILKIDSLYQEEVNPLEYEKLKANIKKLMKESKNSLLRVN